jgi:alpha-L-arabinofuranosidase
MPQAQLTVDPHFAVRRVNRRLFGSFVEHLGRCVYDGIYEPSHPLSDNDGFRTDVLELVCELGVSTIRYPAGNFVSGFRWADAIGPREDRPTRLDLAWHSTESNEVGIEEFAGWLEKTGSELMYALNLRTRGVQEALDVLECANVPSGTELSDLRIKKADHRRRNWPTGPRILEHRYSVLDGVVVGNLLISLPKHADRVTSASMAQLVNAIAPIMTEPGGDAWRQTIFFPFAVTSRLAVGSSLLVRLESDTYQQVCTARYPQSTR